jgi:hypothetical protein
MSNRNREADTKELLRLEALYFKEKPAYLKNGHEGKWVAWSGDKQIALGQDEEETYEEAAKQAQKAIFYFTQIVQEEKVYFMNETGSIKLLEGEEARNVEMKTLEKHYLQHKDEYLKQGHEGRWVVWKNNQELVAPVATCKEAYEKATELVPVGIFLVKQIQQQERVYFIG